MRGGIHPLHPPASCVIARVICFPDDFNCFFYGFFGVSVEQIFANSISQQPIVCAYQSEICADVVSSP